MSTLNRISGIAPSSRLPATLALTGMALVTSACAFAQNADGTDMARVIQTVPVMQQVAVPRQICTNEVVTVPGQKSGAGAVMGGIAGGAIGNQIGQGNGRAAATVIGLIGGAVLGDKIEGGGTPSTQNVQRCSTQTVYETRTTAYNVTYEYAGKQYTVQMPQDPGQWVRVQISPVVPVGSGYSPSSYYPSSTTITNETTYITPYGSYVQPSVTTVRPSVWVDVPPPHWRHHRDDRDWR
ncbi:MAG TPA: glycine zipper 2TM domain-containing protein [Burkholderiaceae bacterium]|nr:glycine zipper 2TM domain-containing protein [Burkholderiaceae bacterium]